MRPVIPALLAVFCFHLPAFSQDHAKPDEAKSTITLPVLPGPSIPNPMPPPQDSMVRLAPDVLYVIQSESACLLFSSPGGAITISRDEGPIRIKGVFADGKGVRETRNYKSKYVYTVEAVTEGKDELIILPLGAKSESEAKRVTFLVGQLPIPPPNPDDVKPPPPPPPPPPEVKSFRVILGYDALKTYPQAVINVLYGNVVEEYLTKSCTGGKNGWRRRDIKAEGDTDPMMTALWKAVQANMTTAPFVAVEVNGKVEIIPFEATPAAMVTKLKTYNGGK